MQRQIIDKIPEFQPSQHFKPIKECLSKIIPRVQNHKKLQNNQKDQYAFALKQIDWSMSKVEPAFPNDIQRMLDNLKSSLQQFDRALAEAKGSSFFCGSGDSNKSLDPIFKRIVTYQNVFAVIAVYQDKKLQYETVNKVIEAVQKSQGESVNRQRKIASEKSLKTDQSPIKEENIRMNVLKQKCDFCELMVSSTLLPNGYKVKKLLKELPDTEWIAGILHEEGKILDKDMEKAIRYYEAARKKNNAQAIYRLGLLNETNKYGRPNEYLKMWEQAARMGHEAALTDLGFLYENGLNDQQTGNQLIAPNPEKALNYYSKAAKTNFPRALNNLASFYYNNSKYKDKNKCLEYFERATDAEYVKSLHNLGLIYYEGELVTQNQSKAVSLIKRSAEKGDLQGKLLYIEMVLSDPYKYQNEQELLDVNRYCREVIAEDQENAEAYHFMGMMYEGGYGVAQQPKTALLYYTKAARYQNPNAYIKLGQCYKNGFGVQKDLRQAIRNYQKVKDTNPQIFVYMAQIYEQGGPDFPANQKLAFDYYYNACNYQIPQAYMGLGRMFQDGRNVKADPGKAQYYFNKAKDLKKKPAKLGNSSDLIQSSYYRSNKK